MTADFVFPTTRDFSGYKLLIVPALYIADDALLQRISDYVKNGGRVVMTFKSGFANENSAVRWVRAPGSPPRGRRLQLPGVLQPRAPACVKGDPFHVGDANQVSSWVEFLVTEHAKAVAYYGHPFFGQWPAVTKNSFGAGTLLYEGTWLSDKLQTAVLRVRAGESRPSWSRPAAPAAVHVQHGVNRLGKNVHYFFNYSAAEAKVPYAGAAGTNLLDAMPVARGAVFTMAPWDVAVVEEP